MSNVENTLSERGARYGDFTDHADIADALINVCGGNGYGPQTNFSRLDPVKRQSIRVICDKLARILSPGGDPEYRDNWHDIQGYAKLAEDRCKDGDAAAQQELPIEEYASLVAAKRDACMHGRECGTYCPMCHDMTTAMMSRAKIRTDSDGDDGA